MTQANGVHSTQRKTAPEIAAACEAIYSQWRRYLSHADALDQAEQFAARFERDCRASACIAIATLAGCGLWVGVLAAVLR